MLPFTTDKPQYLIRFDDICPTMNWTIWREIEATLRKNRVKPILAVVPDNQDIGLVVEDPVPDFWDRVRAWQSLGWTIAVHGYQHRYVTRSGGIMRLRHASEFAGLPRKEQEHKVAAGLQIFAREEVRPDAWIAPGHSFDDTTLSVLRDLGVGVIVDGFARFPFVRSGVTWVPQQLWNYWPTQPGVWTVCLHHNAWTPEYLQEFKETVERVRDQITDVPHVIAQYGKRQYGIGDRLFSIGWQFGRRSRFRAVRGIARRVMS